MILNQLYEFNCDLDMFLNNRFKEIADIIGLEPRVEAKILSQYHGIVGALMRNTLPDNLIHKHVSEKNLYGLAIWNRLYDDFGKMTAKQEADMLLKLLLKLFTLNDSLIEKMEFLESSSYDVFPLTEQKRIWCFYSICDEKLREKLLQLYKLSPEQFTWLNVKNDMGDLIAASKPAIEPTVAEAVFTLLKSLQRRIMIKSKLVCFKCGGVGHKSNVCPSVDDVDYRKLKPPSHITADDEYQSLPPRLVRGKIWVASTSTSTFSDGFYLDSGATLHVTHQKELLHDFSAISGSVTGLASDTSFEIIGKGDLHFLLPDGSPLTLSDVHLVPTCDRNLISVSKATRHGALFCFLSNAVHESRLGLKVATLIKPLPRRRVVF